ncbi:MAG: hypothetical protein HOO96_44785 [Polyangiaceae bacterium]|nr:hypothetical protein [Polyangiaceae bacterium]
MTRIAKSASLTILALLLPLAVVPVACSDSATVKPDGGAGGSDAGPDVNPFEGRPALRVPVPQDGSPVYVSLATPEVTTLTADAAKTSKAWDIQFTGYDLFTNSGPSGPGASQAFGPFDPIVFIDDIAPEAPFITPDKAGGAFLTWYKYEGAPAHALWSRLHVFGVKDGSRLWKVQILGYYGERAGAPVAALYKIRYAEVLDGSLGPTQEADLLDGTAGGPTGTDTSPSECIDLGSGTRTMLSPADARASSAWHMCFRRQNISVNGGTGGPRNVTAVDLDAAKTPDESVDQVKARTPEGEKTAFDAVTKASFATAQFRADGVVSAFTNLWLEKDGRTPRYSAWLVYGADGKKKYVIAFQKFEGQTDKSPGTVLLVVKPMK